MNLRRFSLFFPEKRDFLLEGQGIFAFGGVGSGNQTPGDVPVMFFSRKIGLNQGQAVLVLGGARACRPLQRRRVEHRDGGQGVGRRGRDEFQLGPTAHRINHRTGRLMRVADSVVVITGGARGIGFAIGRSLAASGAKIVLGDVLEPELDASVARIRAAGGRVKGVVADVTSDRDVAALMDAAVETFGAINVVCANAGIIRDGLMLEPDPHTGKIARVLSTEAFRAVFDVNLTGAFITLREAARRMVDNQWPGLLIVTSSIHMTGHPGQINYSSSKAAVALWPKILVGEFHGCGIRHIRVVGIAPGYTATEGVKNMDPTALQAVIKDVHLGRLVEPEELARTIAHVIENDAIDATTIEVTAGVTYGAWQRAR